MPIARLLLFVATLLNISLLASPTTIVVKTDSVYRFKKAYLYAVTDAFTEHRVLQDSTTVGANLTIALRSKAAGTHQLIVSIDRVNCTFFAAENQTYQVFFQALPKNQARTFSNTNEVLPIFYELDEKDINNRISAFNTHFDQFFDSHLSEFLDAGFRDVFEKFRLETEEKFKSPSDSFFDEYRHFSFANLELNIGSSRKLITQKYLTGDKFLVENPEWANFMRKFYQDYVFRFDRLTKNQPLGTALKNGNLTDFLNALSGDDLVKKQPKWADWIAWVVLYTELNENPPKAKQTLQMLENLGKQTSSAALRQVINHGLSAYQWLKPGSPCYPFQLETLDGTAINLKTLANKPTLLCFGAAWSTLSYKEWRLTQTLIQPIKDSINVVYISLDDDMYGTRDLLRSSGIASSSTCSYLNDPYLIEAMNIISVPQFVLIDARGKYFKWHASFPSEELASDLRAVIKASSQPQ
ncbi:MAG TPA: hypothetical protein VFV37_11685 [Luteibaculaceae bacterium]|nr:hypothetical protein [Luteibaculaceae bacterium]